MLKDDSIGLATHYDRKFVWQAMTDYKTYIQMGIYMGMYHVTRSTNNLPEAFHTGILIPVYAIALFAPTIVKELGKLARNIHE